MTEEKPISLSPRLEREFKTVDAMISVYCRKRHGSKKMCAECGQLRDYALERLGKCRYQDDKPVCSKCPVHCYKPAMREKIRDVMRYSGPRMIYRHPLMAIRHIIDRRKRIPPPDKERKAKH